jgi:Cap4 dsDNA endonuclease
MDSSPEKALNEDDPGDDTQRRYRYQATAAAIWSLALYDEAAGLEAIYCEHHEDVLFHKKGDRFIGTQVKTKLDELGPHKSTDEEVLRSLKRFVHLEQQFPGYFDGYRLCSNAGFWSEEKTGTNLRHILELAATDDLQGKCPRLVLDYLSKAFPKPDKPKLSKAKAQSNASATNAAALAQYSASMTEWERIVLVGRKVLKKLTIDKLSGLSDVRIVLIGMLPSCPLVGDRLHSELGQIADALIAEMLKAGSLAHDSQRDRYLIVFDKPEEILASEIIAGKRITTQRLDTVLGSCIAAVPTLVTSGPITVADLPSGLRTMELKMAAGGISISNIALAKDLKASTESLLLRWLHRDGRKAADQRYQHLRTVVRNQAQEAFDNAETEDRPFGQQMLADLRRRLESRYSNNPTSFFGCTYEHLLGMAGILTEDCALWWSESFAIPPAEAAS